MSGVWTIEIHVTDERKVYPPHNTPVLAFTKIGWEVCLFTGNDFLCDFLRRTSDGLVSVYASHWAYLPPDPPGGAPPL